MRHQKLLPVLIAFLAILVLSVPGLAGRPVVQASPVEQTADSPPCRTYGKVSAEPNTMLYGEYFTTTIRVDAACADYEDALHIVLVLDASGSMAGGPTYNMKVGAKRLIQELDLENNPNIKIDVVQFNSAARIMCELTNHAGRAASCTNKIGASGGSAIDKGIKEGLKVLVKGRSDAPGRIPREVMLVLSDGVNNDGCPKVLKEAELVKRDGVQIFTVCLGGDCERDCLRQVASSALLFYEIAESRFLVQVFDHIRRAIQTTRLQKLSVSVQAPTNMDIVLSSISGNGRWDERGRVIYWEDEFVATSGMTLTYRQRSLESGFQPVSSAIWADSTDIWGRQHREDFSVPKVLILGGAK